MNRSIIQDTERNCGIEPCTLVAVVYSLGNLKMSVYGHSELAGYLRRSRAPKEFAAFDLDSLPAVISLPPSEENSPELFNIVDLKYFGFQEPGKVILTYGLAPEPQPYLLK